MAVDGKRGADAGVGDGVTLGQALPTWIRVALLSFGGPAGQIAVMHRLVVEERKWIDEERFLHAMSYCMLLPGPEAQQLATYLGWLLHGWRGGLVAGVLFIVPGFVSLFVLSVVYAELRDAAFVAGLFYGLKPAVMIIVIAALATMADRTLESGAKKAIAGGAFVGIFFFNVPFPLIVLLSALLGFVWARAGAGAVSPRRPAARPSLGSSAYTTLLWGGIWALPIALLLLSGLAGSVYHVEAVFFSKVAVVTFGGAYAVLAYIAQQAVEVHHWLAAGEMLDGLGMAETTPGPLIQVVQFVGFLGAYRNPGPLSPLAAGALGSVITAWVTFVPCFLFVFVGAPIAEYLRGHPGLQAALQGITAAVVGVVLNLAVWFSLHTLFREVRAVSAGPLRLWSPTLDSLEPAALVIGLAAAIATFRYRLGMLSTLAGGAAAGVLWHVLVR